LVAKPYIIVTTKRAPEERIKKIREKGAEIIVAGEDLVDFEELMPVLLERGIKSLMVEGGSSINWEFIRRGFVDEVRLIHLPVIVGGENVPTLVGGFKRGHQLITEWEVIK